MSSENMFNKDIKRGGLGGGIISPNSYAELQKQPSNPNPQQAFNVAGAAGILQLMGALMQTLPQIQQVQQSQNPMSLSEPVEETETEGTILASEETIKEFKQMQQALKENETRLNYLSDKKEKDNHLEGTVTAINGNHYNDASGVYYEVNEGEPYYLPVLHHTKVVDEDLNKATLQNKLHQLELEANKVREELQAIYFEEWKGPLFDGLKQVLNSSNNSVMLVYPAEDGAIVDVLEFTSESEGVKQYTSETMSVFVTEK